MRNLPKPDQGMLFGQIGRIDNMTKIEIKDTLLEIAEFISYPFTFRFVEKFYGRKSKSLRVAD